MSGQFVMKQIGQHMKMMVVGKWEDTEGWVTVG